MGDVPENLQVIKAVQISNLLAVEKSPTHNIKERLKNHVHVKQRLQQEHMHMHIAELGDNSINKAAVGETATANNKRKEKQKEQQKIRRPRKSKDDNKNYSKSVAVATEKDKLRRVTKSVPELLSNFMAHEQSIRPKMKHFGSGANMECSNDGNGATLMNCLGGGNGEDDGSHDGSQEAETKSPTGREKETKEKDVLGMVLSLKKRALLQDPEVQEFLSNIMSVFKS